MKYFKLIVAFFLMNNILFAQEKFKKHIVKKSETIKSIAKKYDITPRDIYELNPDAVNNLKINTTLLIPSKKESVKIAKIEPAINKNSNLETTTHKVLEKETLYSISKKYDVTVKALCDVNLGIEKNGIKFGEIINIPQKKSQNTTTTIPEIKNESITEKKSDTNNSLVNKILMQTTHEVQQKETKFGIAKQYGITVSDLEKMNPILVSEELKIGQIISVPLTSETKNLPLVENKNIDIASKTESKTEIITENKIHTVKKKETKYSISKQYGITVSDLETLNPDIASNMPVGLKLIVAVPKPEVKEVFSNTSNSKLELKETPTLHPALKSSFIPNIREELVNRAFEEIGVRYQSGGTSKKGFDCSGLIITTFEAFDIKLPRSSIEQSEIGNRINREQAKKGDLIFFRTNGRNRINHVGMITDIEKDGEIKFIHASRKGVIISSSEESYYKNRIVQINRVLE